VQAVEAFAQGRKIVTAEGLDEDEVLRLAGVRI
jgi:hypothetical protein